MGTDRALHAPTTGAAHPNAPSSWRVDVDTSFGGPYGPPMGAAAQARFDACWPAEAAAIDTLLALARHVLGSGHPTGAPHAFPHAFVGVWVWGAQGPLCIRRTFDHGTGILEWACTGPGTPPLAWREGGAVWAASLEGRRTLETVQTRVDTTGWSRHRRLALLQWAQGPFHPAEPAGA